METTRSRRAGSSCGPNLCKFIVNNILAVAAAAFWRDASVLQAASFAAPGPLWIGATEGRPELTGLVITASFSGIAGARACPALPMVPA